MEADAELAAAHGGCARFGMDDGYFVGPRKAVFQVLQKFAKRVKEQTRGRLMPSKCKWYRLA